MLHTFSNFSLRCQVKKDFASDDKLLAVINFFSEPLPLSKLAYSDQKYKNII